MDVPAGGTPRSGTFLVSFDQPGFNQITANIDPEEAGLQVDNVRYAVIDVRKQVPVLLVDGDPINGSKPGGDTFHVQMALNSAKGYQLVTRGVNELEQPNLDQYASIYLLNVGTLSDKALKNVESYLRDGGSVAFFLGDKVRSDFYTDRFYNKGKGIFPAPLRDRPQPPLSEEEMQPDLFDNQLKLFVRDEKHPIFAEVWQPNYRAVFNFLPIKRYFPVPRRDWLKNPNVEELATLPNQRSMRDYSGEAQSVVDALTQAVNDPKFDKYKAAIDRHKSIIRNLSLTDRPLYELANALDAFLKEKPDKEKDDPQQPSLADFWKLPEAQKLRGLVEKFRDTVQLGDPLVIAGTYGKGKMVAFLTTAGLAWNNWGGGSPAQLSYPAIMVELQKFLTSGTADTSRLVGNPLTIEADSSRYEPRLRCFYQPEARDNAGNAGDKDAKASGPVDKGEVLGTEQAGRVTFTFDAAKKPGLYRFELTQRADTSAKEAKTDTRAFVFNVDPAEGELARAPRDELEKSAPGIAKVRPPGTNWGTELANRQNDFSESPWFYLLFLVILVIEQALAVHLSFHLKGSEAQPPVAAPRPQEAATAA
jgi:hypothetical protein